VNKLVLHPDVQDYIRSFQGDITQLAFTGSSFDGITVPELIQQIEGHRKAEKKLPKWHATAGVFFPPKLNIEQTSSEATAAYKASLVPGTSCIDLTGGLGVDTQYFSEVFDRVTHCEINEDLLNIASHNSNRFNVSNIDFVCADGVATALSSFHDVIYVDPSRRHGTKGKVFYLKDCEPQLPNHISALMDCCHVLLVKTSPMLDLSIGMDEMQHVAEIHIVAVNNEVKELLWMIKKETTTTKVVTINLNQNEQQKFTFTLGETAQIAYSDPQKYLYEPNSAILKSGAFTLLPSAFEVDKIAQHTHVYTSALLVGFPGRSFMIESMIPYSKKEMIQSIKGLKAHVTTRNFSETVASLRKKWKLSDGGDVYLFFVTLEDGQRVALKCSKALL